MKHLHLFESYLGEGKNIADVYHFTKLPRLESIVAHGIRFSTRDYERRQQEAGWRNRLSKFNDTYTKYISTTRHKDIGKVLTGDREQSVRLTLDAAAIATRYAIVPIDFVAQTQDYGKHKSPKTKGDLGQSSSVAANAFEERIISPRKDDTEEFLPLKYIKKVDIFVGADDSGIDVGETVERVQSALGNIPCEIHHRYPAPSARMKSAYALGDVQFEEGLTVKSLPIPARRILSSVVDGFLRTLGSTDVVVRVAPAPLAFWLTIEADLPQYRNHSEDALLYSARISRAGVVSIAETHYDHVNRFKKLATSASFVDDYLNDRLLVYHGKKEAAVLGYHWEDKELIWDDVDVRVPKLMDGEQFLDMLYTALPNQGFTVLPSALMPYRALVPDVQNDWYELDPENPARIGYRQNMYEDL